jgi:hypothetical protein
MTPFISAILALTARRRVGGERKGRKEELLSPGRARLRVNRQDEHEHRERPDQGGDQAHVRCLVSMRTRLRGTVERFVSASQRIR